MSNQQPGDADGMVAAARDYAQNNRGGKYHAILWPFAALNSYNIAEDQYQGNWLPTYRLGCHLLKSLNVEYARLQRLDHTFSLLRDRSEVENAAQLVRAVTYLQQNALSMSHNDKMHCIAGVCHSIYVVMLQVMRALRAYDKLETLANLAVVDEDAAEFDASLHDRLFVADTAESMLRIASIAGKKPITANVHVASPSHLVKTFAFKHGNHMIVADMTSALDSNSLGGTEPVTQHCFQIGTYGVNITENGTVMSTKRGSCLLGPALQSGQVYYLKFEVQAWSGDGLFFGVTTNTDPGGAWLNTDAGWFLKDDKGRSCKLTGMNYTFDPKWSSWKTGDRPLFRVDLLANTVAVQLSRGWQIVREACLQVAPQGAVFFCVTMSDLGRVKVLHVTPQDVSSL